MHPFEQTPVILVIADVEETRIGIEKLLTADRYSVLAVRGPADLAHLSRDISPDLVLMTLSTSKTELVTIAHQTRKALQLSDNVPVVLFAVTNLEEGSEIKIEPNIYLTHPDNFNQLRRLINRLVRRPEGIH